MNEKILIKYWQNINYKSLLEYLDAGEAADATEDTEFMPLDKEICFILTDGIEYMLQKTGDQVVVTESVCNAFNLRK